MSNIKQKNIFVSDFVRTLGMQSSQENAYAALKFSSSPYNFWICLFLNFLCPVFTNTTAKHATALPNFFCKFVNKHHCTRLLIIEEKKAKNKNFMSRSRILDLQMSRFELCIITICNNMRKLLMYFLLFFCCFASQQKKKKKKNTSDVDDYAHP